jgi:RHS repeat-associated protein
VYDANGNMTQKLVDGAVVMTFVYNAENRLVQVQDGIGTTIADYYYDPFGRRLWKEVSGVRTYFLYADEGLVAEYDESGNELRSYGYAPNSYWTTDPVFLKDTGTYYFYHTDHLGAPVKLVQSNGAVVWSATYDAFGQASIEVETVKNHLRFPGQYYDEETGLHYNWNRYYDPETGRYTSRDPSVSSELNPYKYSLNNPLKWIDFNGLQVVDVITSAAPSLTSVQVPDWLPEEHIGDPLFDTPPFIDKREPWPYTRRWPSLAWEGHSRSIDDFRWKVPDCEFHLLQGHASWSPHYISYKEPCAGATIYGCRVGGSPRTDDPHPLGPAIWQYLPKQIDNQGLDSGTALFIPTNSYRSINDVYNDPNSAMREYSLPPSTHTSDSRHEREWRTKFTILNTIRHFKEICAEGKCCCPGITFKSYVFTGPLPKLPSHMWPQDVTEMLMFYSDRRYSQPLGKYFPSIDDIEFTIPCHNSTGQ